MKYSWTRVFSELYFLVGTESTVPVFGDILCNNDLGKLIWGLIFLSFEKCVILRLFFFREKQLSHFIFSISKNLQEDQIH